MGFLLFIIASFLKWVFAPVLYGYGFFASLVKGGSKEWNRYNKDLAIAKDQYGNTLGGWVFNDILITKESRCFFGNPDECISSVIGKNKRDGTLTRLGKLIDKILDFFDENHSVESIDETESYDKK